MEIPFFIFLILYLVGLGIFFLFSFFNLYHIIKFGLFDTQTKGVTVLFLGLSLAIIVISFVMTREVDWLDTFLISISLPTL